MSTPKRIQLRRTKGYRKPEGAVVVARPSKWGNPITLEIERLTWNDRHGSATAEALRESAVRAFRDGLPGFISDPEIAYPSFDDIRSELAGRDLACWCPLDQPCHADVLLEIANGTDPDDEGIVRDTIIDCASSCGIHGEASADLADLLLSDMSGLRITEATQ